MMIYVKNVMEPIFEKGIFVIGMNMSGKHNINQEPIGWKCIFCEDKDA